MAKDDCFVYYIIATMLDGTKKVHSFPHLIGANCSYKYVNMKGEVLDLSKFTSRTKHQDSSLAPALGNVIHETREQSSRISPGQPCIKWTGTLPVNESKFCEPNYQCGPDDTPLGNKSTCVPVRSECKSSCCKDQYTCITKCPNGGVNCCQVWVGKEANCMECMKQYC